MERSKATAKAASCGVDIGASYFKMPMKRPFLFLLLSALCVSANLSVARADFDLGQRDDPIVSLRLGMSQREVYRAIGIPIRRRLSSFGFDSDDGMYFGPDIWDIGSDDSPFEHPQRLYVTYKKDKVATISVETPFGSSDNASADSVHLSRQGIADYRRFSELQVKVSTCLACKPARAILYSAKRSNRIDDRIRYQIYDY